MKYRILLFDVDNTLLDFDANEEESFRLMMEDMGETWTKEIYQTYKQLNTRLWKRIEKGEITVDEGVNRRFADLMALYGKAVDGPDWERAYRRHLNQGVQEIPGVHPVLKRLRESCELYVITNGIQQTQEFRMARSGLDQYFKDMFISGRIGAGKPSKEFFDHVKNHIQWFEPKEALVIGDSLSSDIKGGIDAGIPTCWFARGKDGPSRERELRDSGLCPDHVIGELTELFDVQGEPAAWSPGYAGGF